MFKFFADRDRVYLYPWYLAEECLTDDLEKIFGIKIEKTLLEFKNNHIYGYIDTVQYNQVSEFFFEKVKAEKGFYKEVEKNILKTGDSLINFCENVKKLNLKKLSNKELAELYQEYAQKTRTMRAWGWVPVLIDGSEIAFLTDYIQKEFKEFLKKHNKENSFADLYSILSSSDKKSEIQSEEIERLRLTEKIQEKDPKVVEIIKEKEPFESVKIIEEKYPKIFALIKKHTEKFSWLTYAYIGPKMSEIDVIKLVRDSLKKGNIPEEIMRIEHYPKEVHQQKQKILRELNLPEELRYLFEVSTFFMALKDMRKGIYQKSYVIMDTVIEEIARRINLTVQQTKYLNRHEIDQVLLEGKDLNKITKERIKHCAVIIENGNASVFIGIEAEKILKEMVEKEDKTDIQNSSEIKGTIAYSGKATGRAKIILVKDDIQKMNEGDILISSATNPDLILAMRKASAFVTDFGGITCHAAIVSRELKKPCIVGTKNATKLIKDDDLIEVDATKGIVKILQRSRE